MATSGYTFQKLLIKSATTVALLSAFFNFLLLLVMCRTKSVRENSVQSFTFAIIATDWVFGGWLIGFNYLVSDLDESCSLSCQFSTQGWPRNENIWIYSTNSAIILILLNIQIAMSGDRVLAFCFPMSYVWYKDSKYRKWIAVGCAAAGTLCGFLYGFVEFSIGTDVNSYNLKVDLYYKTFMAVYATVAVAAILSLNITVIYSTIQGVKLSQTKTEANCYQNFISRARRVANP